MFHSELNNLVDKYVIDFGIESLKLNYLSSKGYFLSMKSTEKIEDFKQYFIQILKKKTKYHCTTEEIDSLNTRIKDSIEEIFLLTDS